MYRCCFKITINMSCLNTNVAVQGVLGALLFSTGFLVMWGIWAQLPLLIPGTLSSLSSVPSHSAVPIISVQGHNEVPSCDIVRNRTASVKQPCLESTSVFLQMHLSKTTPPQSSIWTFIATPLVMSHVCLLALIRKSQLRRVLNLVVWAESDKLFLF